MFLTIKISSVPTHGQTLALHVTREGEQYVVRTSEGNIHAALQARQAYPGTYCYSLPDGSVALGYGPLQPAEADEFLQIVLSPSGAVRITRDVFCTLPLFYGTNTNLFVVSNNFAQVATNLPELTIDKSAIARLLHDPLLKQPYTIWHEIDILGEREILTWQNNALQHIPAAPRSWTYSSELPISDARDFPRLLKEHFTYFAETRLASNTLGFELSGGLDSSFLPLFLTTNGYILDAAAGSMVYPDQHSRQRQLQKLEALEFATGLRSNKIYLMPEKHYPLATMIETGDYQPFHFMHELYESATIEMAEDFQARGVQIVVTGGGGDQLLEHRPHPTIRSQEDLYQKLPPPPFVTEVCRQLFQLPDPYAPQNTLLSPGIAHEHIAHSNIYIERGMWPVSPFHSVKLFNFCQALPIQFRANKNIFRAYFEAHNFPGLLFLGDNEDFSNFFESCWQSGVYEQLAQRLLKNSVLQSLGLVDATRFRAANVVATDIDQQHSLYVLLMLELNLQMLNKA